MAEKNTKKTKKTAETEKKAKRAGAKKKAGAQAPKKVSKAKALEKEEGGDRPVVYQMKLLTFSFFSLLSLLAVLHLPLGALGPFIRSIFTGLFSYGGYALPFFFMIYIMMRLKEKDESRKKRYIVAIVLMYMAVLYSLALVFSYQMEVGYSLSTALDFYEKGVNLRGGGIIGSLLFYPLYNLIGRVGLSILILAFIMASLTLISSLKFTDVLSLMGKSIRQGGKKALDAGVKLIEHKEGRGEEALEGQSEMEGVEIPKGYVYIGEDEPLSLHQPYEGEEEEHILDLFFKPKKVRGEDIQAKEDFRFLEYNEKGEVINRDGRPNSKEETEAQGFQFIDIPKTRRDGSQEGQEKTAQPVMPKEEKEAVQPKTTSVVWRKEGYVEEEAKVEAPPAPITQRIDEKIEKEEPVKEEAAYIIEPEKQAEPTLEKEDRPSPSALNEEKKENRQVSSDLSEKEVEGLIIDAADLPNSNYYELPSLEMLKQGESTNDTGSLQDIKAKAAILTETFKSFKVDCEVVSAERGPMITRFEVRPMPGVKISKIAQLNDDIALKLAATQVRILAPIPGKAAVGIEVPNEKVSVVRLRDVLESEEYKQGDSLIRFGLGKDISGKDIVPDLAKMPHLLIAGATGSGKSVCVNTIIASILFNSKPDEVKFLMIDPKVVELGIYNGIAHLLLPVVTDATKASIALNWAVNEMTRRYNVFASTKCKDITSYNEKVEAGLIEEGEAMPRIVIIIDELADLMMVAQKQVEDSIARIAQMARAAGMHLIVATQRPSVDIITGVIKANIPSRIAFAVSSHIDSRTIIDEQGAEKLLGKGDMLFLNAGKSKPTRVQGAFITDNEIEALVNYIKAEAAGDPVYDETVVDAAGMSFNMEKPDMESDSLLNAAISFAISSGKCSTSMIQRKFKIGYNRAARIVEEMEERGIVGPANGAKPREIINSAYQVDEDYSFASDMED